MEARELRIGNYILFGDEIVEVESIALNKGVCNIYFHSIQSTTNSTFPIDLFEPIPLTEEILLKCGFKYLNGRTSGDLTFDVLHYEFDYIDGVFVTKSRYEPFECREKLYNFKYLHQLQNLYFALTGKELDIDLSR